MKINSLLLFGAALVALGSCATGNGEKTLLKGQVKEGIDSVTVQVRYPGTELDTVVAVAGGNFSLEIPTDRMSNGVVKVEHTYLPFIPDGSELEVVIADSSYICSKDEKSLQNAIVAYDQKMQQLYNDFMNLRRELSADTALNDEEKNEKLNEAYEELTEDKKALCLETLKDNPDNFLGASALSNVYYELDMDELQTLVNGLSEEMKAQETIKSIIASLEAKQATAEGKMFVDFEVQTVIGHDRSMAANPVYSTVKLSDYVGKGKYVLVDFWSPWCGPCKREMPNIKAIYDKWHGEHFDVLSVAVWEREDVRVTMETADKLGVTWNQINNAKSIPTELYGIDGIPHIILFGPDGTILKRGLHGTELAETVDEYLSKLN